MTDLRALTDAFAELERRADAASAGMPYPLPTRARSRRALRPGSGLVPVAATVAVVAGLAVGAVLLAPGGDPSPSGAGAPPGEDPRTSVGAPPTTSGPASTSAPAFVIPLTPDELTARFRVVLGDTATFRVTDSSEVKQFISPPSPSAGPNGQEAPLSESEARGTTVGAAIIGTLTASGVTGGFDLQIFPRDGTVDRTWCDNPDPSGCTVRQLADGSTLTVGRVPLDSPNGMTYTVNLERSDGVVFLMHVSNERRPKGGSEVLAPHPPLTTDQMVAIVTSDRW